MTSADINSHVMHVDFSVLSSGMQPGIQNSEWLEMLRLVSQRTRMSGDFSKRKDSTLQNLVGILRMCETERLWDLGDYFVESD